MTPEAFRLLIATVTDRIRGRTSDAQLDAELNREFPAGGPVFDSIFNACQGAIEFTRN